MESTTKPKHADRLAELALADERFGILGRRSLGPDRETVTPLRELGARLLGDPVPDEVACAFVTCLCTTAELMRREFPGNLFWDLDLLAGTLLRKPPSQPRVDEWRRRIEETTDLLRGVHEIFGRGSVIRFRYTHDFIYGYDWARWAARDPAARRQIGPYDPEFLRYVRQRGEALAELIVSGTDDQYPMLAADEFRNPFPFVREPDAEIELHRGLAREGLIPVPGWDVDGHPDFDRDYSELRLRRARQLSLLKMPTPAPS